MPQRSLSKRLWYDFLRVLCRVVGVTFFRIRVFNRQCIPRTGSALVVSNHQSHFDPILVGLSCDRRLNYVARQTLFGFAPFRWLINSLDAIPIDREGTGLGGLKESLRRLKAGEMLLIFPEGTRTPDGEVGHLKSGFLALARRSKVPLLPVAIDGAYDAWPKRHRLPGLAVIHVRFAQPFSPEEVAQFDDVSLLAEVDRRIRDCHVFTRRIRLRAVCHKAR
ncbi:MAG TPA: lysophospholipid acyltransferase family protein [Pirellulales bacterium]|jgi:1-acyl-sn-glycerol-3-phosphate acyltransferase|nr:lysophospholipid acyltransferase family protein [Pirellulales bacterium]